MNCSLAALLLLGTLLSIGRPVLGHAGHGSETYVRDSAQDGPRSKMRDLGPHNMTFQRLTSRSVLVAVFSGAGSDGRLAARRLLIRNTWGAFVQDVKMELLFVVSARNVSSGTGACPAGTHQPSRTPPGSFLRTPGCFWVG